MNLLSEFRGKTTISEYLKTYLLPEFVPWYRQLLVCHLRNVSGPCPPFFFDFFVALTNFLKRVKLNNLYFKAIFFSSGSVDSVKAFLPAKDRKLQILHIFFNDYDLLIHLIFHISEEKK